MRQSEDLINVISKLKHHLQGWRWLFKRALTKNQLKHHRQRLPAIGLAETVGTSASATVESECLKEFFSNKRTAERFLGLSRYWSFKKRPGLLNEGPEEFSPPPVRWTRPVKPLLLYPNENQKGRGVPRTVIF